MKLTELWRSHLGPEFFSVDSVGTWTMLNYDTETFCHDTTWWLEAMRQERRVWRVSTCCKAGSSQLIGQRSGWMTLSCCCRFYFKLKGKTWSPDISSCLTRCSSVNQQVHSQMKCLSTAAVATFTFYSQGVAVPYQSTLAVSCFMSSWPHMHSYRLDSHLKTFTVSHSFVPSQQSALPSLLLPNQMHQR